MNIEFYETKQFYNTGSVGIVPKESLKLFDSNIRKEAQSPTSNEVIEKIVFYYRNTKVEIAKLLNVDINNLAYIQSTNLGISTVLQSLAWHEGDKIIVGKNEYIDAILPFYALSKKFGVEIIRLKGEQSIKEVDLLMDEHVKMVFMSHIEYNTGHNHSISRISQNIKNRENVILMIDGAQAVGQIPIEEIDYCDIYVFPVHKWLLGPTGTGFIYITDKIVNQIIPVNICSIGGQIINNEVIYNKKASIVENSSFNFCQYSIVYNNLKLFDDFGWSRVYNHIEEMATYLSNQFKSVFRFKEMKITACNGMVFVEGENLEVLYNSLIENKYICKFICEENKIRFTVHLYNNESDIDEMIDFIDREAYTERGVS